MTEVGVFSFELHPVVSGERSLMVSKVAEVMSKTWSSSIFKRAGVFARVMTIPRKKPIHSCVAGNSQLHHNMKVLVDESRVVWNTEILAMFVAANAWEN
ncbi:hypothetical protein TNCV_1511011 [Trichonephila clavipes]|nr:hypothetical protein TNCV_1511011 [Trichonephila clavipes]